MGPAPLLLAWLLLGASTTPPADARSLVIRGTIVAADGEPIAGVPVEALPVPSRYDAGLALFHPGRAADEEIHPESPRAPLPTTTSAGDGSFVLHVLPGM